MPNTLMIRRTSSTCAFVNFCAHVIPFGNDVAVDKNNHNTDVHNDNIRCVRGTHLPHRVGRRRVSPACFVAGTLPFGSVPVNGCCRVGSSKVRTGSTIVELVVAVAIVIVDLVVVVNFLLRLIRCWVDWSVASLMAHSGRRCGCVWFWCSAVVVVSGGGDVPLSILFLSLLLVAAAP